LQLSFSPIVRARFRFAQSVVTALRQDVFYVGDSLLACGFNLMSPMSLGACFARGVIQVVCAGKAAHVVVGSSCALSDALKGVLFVKILIAGTFGWQNGERLCASSCLFSFPLQRLF